MKRLGILLLVVVTFIGCDKKDTPIYESQKNETITLNNITFVDSNSSLPIQTGNYIKKHFIKTLIDIRGNEIFKIIDNYYNDTLIVHWDSIYDMRCPVGRFCDIEFYPNGYAVLFFRVNSVKTNKSYRVVAHIPGKTSWNNCSGFYSTTDSLGYVWCIRSLTPHPDTTTNIITFDPTKPPYVASMYDIPLWYYKARIFISVK